MPILSIPHDKPHLTLIRCWFILAITSLGLSGIFSLAPALLRGHFFQQHIDTQHLFDVSLVLHVNLSVLVWILTFTTLFWCLSLPRKFLNYGYGLWIIAVFGTYCMVIAPFIGGEPIKSNYIPVLLNKPFFIGLSMIGFAVTSHSLLYLFQRPPSTPLMLGLWTAAITLLLAILCFIAAGYLLTYSPSMDAETFYNLLFWGGGHVLQFTYITTLLVAWLWLASVIGISLIVSPRLINGLFLINLLFVLPAPLFFVWVPDLTENLALFTRHMQLVAGIVPSITGLVILGSWIRSKRPPITTSPAYIRSALFFSLLFFAYGGILGLFIRQMNTIVPAHYHASIVGGLTMALMGLAYHLLPKLGYRPPHTRLANIQPYLYSIGHLLHITGLAVMGGYGALRKTAADTGGIDTLIGKWMFFTGSPLALLGGLLFILVVLLAMKKPSQAVISLQNC